MSTHAKRRTSVIHQHAHEAYKPSQVSKTEKNLYALYASATAVDHLNAPLPDRKTAGSVKTMVPTQSFAQRMKQTYKRALNFAKELEKEVAESVESWDVDDLIDFCEKQDVPFDVVKHWTYAHRVKFFTALILDRTDLNELGAKRLVRMMQHTEAGHQALHNLADAAMASI